MTGGQSGAPRLTCINATILGFPVEGEEMVVLREGTNDWTCFTD